MDQSIVSIIQSNFYKPTTLGQGTSGCFIEVLFTLTLLTILSWNLARIATYLGGCLIEV